jgi:hypothetical protein
VCCVKRWIGRSAGDFNSKAAQPLIMSFDRMMSELLF